MPELPEIETLARELQKKISGFVFSKIIIQNHSILESSGDEIAALIPGKLVENIVRQGKYLGLNLGNRQRLWFHLGMTGQLLLEPKFGKPGPHTHLVLEFLDSDLRLAFRDIRRFGCVFLEDAQREIPARLKRLGPEPMSLKAEEFSGLFKKRTGKIKSLLLNQTIVSGLGNIYTDESLYRANLNPNRRPAKITAQRMMRLHGAVCEVLNEAISAGGSSIDDYRHSDGSRGSFQKFHRVYGREGEPCRTCGSVIKRTVISGRSSFFCQQCQK